MKHLQTTCLKSRRSSPKRNLALSNLDAGVISKACLVEPEVIRLMTTLQDTLCRDKAVVDEILEGLKNLGTSNTKKCESTKVSACKLACAHLVRLCLQSRRATVSALLRIKKHVMDITMDGIHDFGSGVHVAWREPKFYDAGYLHNAIVPSPIAVDVAGQCELPDFVLVSS